MRRYGFLVGYAERTDDETFEMLELRNRLARAGIEPDWEIVPQSRRARSSSGLCRVRNSDQVWLDLAKSEQWPALSVRQPYADELVRNVKLVEYRPSRTHMRGRVLIYAARTPEPGAGELPRGKIIGHVWLFDCQEGMDSYEWVMCEAYRFADPVPVPGGVHPQPVWWYPFGRGGARR